MEMTTLDQQIKAALDAHKRLNDARFAEKEARERRWRAEAELTEMLGNLSADQRDAVAELAK